MKVNGNKLRQRIRVLELDLKTAINQFQDVLTRFEGENKPSPQAVDETIMDVEMKIAKLQEAQQRYNLLVKPKIRDKEYTLCELVKMVGGAGRREKMWRLVAAPKRDRYSYRDPSLERDPTKQYARPQVSVEEAVERAKKAALFAAEIREAIAWGNAQDIELDIDPKLLA